MKRAPGLALTALLAAVGVYLAAMPGLKVLGALTVAMFLGMAWRVVGDLTSRGSGGIAGPFRLGVKFAARPLLRAGIVLLGVRLHFGLLAQAGPKILLLDCIIVALGLAGIYAIAKACRVDPRLGMLLAVGTSICGASAVVAAGPVTRADDEDVTLAVGLCGILGTIGVLSLIAAGPFLGLAPAQLGVLSGSSLHEVAQVVAASFTWGQESGEVATLVKLTRVVLLGPALIALGLLFRDGVSAPRRGTGPLDTDGASLPGEMAAGAAFSWANPPVPWFVLGFLAMAGVNSLGVFSEAVRATLTQASVLLMATAMAAMGLQVDFAHLRRTGPRVLVAGLAGFALLAGVSYTLIRTLQIG
jgi:uncharacterized integral membrane protein (TIGR00698 family)